MEHPPVPPIDKHIVYECLYQCNTLSGQGMGSIDSGSRCDDSAVIPCRSRDSTAGC